MAGCYDRGAGESRSAAERDDDRDAGDAVCDRGSGWCRRMRSVAGRRQGVEGARTVGARVDHRTRSETRTRGPVGEPAEASPSERDDPAVSRGEVKAPGEDPELLGVEFDEGEDLLGGDRVRSEPFTPARQEHVSVGDEFAGLTFDAQSSGEVHENGVL